MRPYINEIAVAALLLLTVSVILANSLFPRTLEVNPSQAWRVLPAVDIELGGKSTAETVMNSDGFQMTFQLDKGYHSPYAVLNIIPVPKTPVDIDWLESVSVRYRCEGDCGSHIVFHARNYDPSLGPEEDLDNRLYNQALLPVSARTQTIELKREDFFVPCWWVANFGREGKDCKIDFSAIDWFEFVTIEKTGSGKMIIESFVVEGHWISPAFLNQFFLSTWVVVAIAILCRRVQVMRNELAKKQKLEHALIETSCLLSNETRKYWELAQKDPLTNLLSRYGIEEALKQWQHTAKADRIFSIVLFDVDHFKEINDGFGHAFGDQVLREIGKLTQPHLPPNALLARWGGDEFLILLPDSDLALAKKTADAIQRELKISSLHATCSFGVCQSKPDESFEGTFQRADAALYRSKRKGRNAITAVDKNDTSSSPFAKKEPLKKIAMHGNGE